ncbi:DUF1934 domain-containing protein [Acutalibacter sp.]|uniref:DUF1934 domain-containing protein n=1 Tax=Acutalibacter sp. TaxID=1918636 RepID=UPI0034DEBB92
MLREDYVINITGRQFYEEDSGEVTLSTTGTYTVKDKASFIAYKEYDEDDPRVSHTAVLKVEPGKVTMMRGGSATRLILEEGRRHLCMYDTGFGPLTLGVFTSELSTELGRDGGYMVIKYTLDVDSNLSSQNELRVEVSPLAPPPL